MAKKQKTKSSSKSGLTAKTALVSIIPVLSAIVLIAVVGLVVVLVGNANNKRPTFDGANDVYFTYDSVEITKDELYTNMKIDYGAAELMRLIDEVLYAKEIKAAKENADTDKLLVEYILQSLFSIEITEEDKASLENTTKTWEDLVVEALEENLEDNQESWEDLIDSLKMNNLLADSSDDKVTSLSSNVWTTVKDHYRLQFVRKEWAKDAYVEQYKNNKDKEAEEKGTEKGVYFTEDEIEDKYEAEYTGTTYALFIPFTSEAAAKAMMAKYHINTQSSTSINQNGWIKDTYDYNKNSTTDKSSHKMTNEEVLTVFYQMYNEVLSYYNAGKDIIDLTKDLDKSINNSQAFNQAVENLDTTIEDLEVTGKVILPTEIIVNGGTNVTVTWEIKENQYVALENNVLTLKSTEDGTKGSFDLTAKLEAKVSDTETYSKTLTFDLQSEVVTDAKENTIKVEEVKAEAKNTLTEEFMNSFEGNEAPNQFSKFVWSAKELSAIDSKLSSNLKYGGTLKPIVGNSEYAGFYKSYTVAPIKGSNYTYLMIKFEEVAPKELEAVKDEIKEKLLEGLETDNNITSMIYQKRYDAGLQIYDKYLEAVYDYEYTYFHETTLKLTSYNKFKDSKKNKTDVVASFTVDGEEKTITAEELYKALEAKYGVSTTVDFINSYLTVGNPEYNNVYNPFTGVVNNEAVLKELFEKEVSSFRNNFEMDYFTYSYLSYYGFIPNFPATYGWNDFRKDYFGAMSDRDLLVSSSFGGHLYSEALDALKEDAFLEYHNAKLEEGAAKYESYEQLLDALVAKKIKEIKDAHYSLNVLNVIVSIDTNYDGSYDTNYVNKKGADRSEDDVWTDELEDQAVELAKLIYAKAPETLKDTLANQLTQVVLEYNEAGFDHEVWGAYKKAGLVVKFENSQTYTNTSSLVEEFLDQLQILWDQIPEDLRGETLDAALLSEAPFESSYGYHHIAITGSTEVTELPEEEAQLAIYKALLKYNEVKDSTYSFQEAEKEETLEALEALLKEYGYELELSKKESLTEEETTKVAESKAEFLKKYGFDIDKLAFDEATTKLLGTYYDTPVSEIEGGNEITQYTVNFLNKQIAESKFQFTDEATKADRLAQLQYIINVTQKDIDESEKEAE